MLYVFARAMATDGDASEGEDWQRIAVILIVGVFSIVFWMGFEQAGGTLNLFADEKTDRHALRPRVPGVVLPVDQPAPDLHPGPALLDPLDGARPDPVPADLVGQDGGRACSCSGLGFVVMYQAEQAGRRRPARSGPQWLAVGLPAVHARRALPLADRPVAGQQAGPGADRLADDGGLVPLHGDRQLPGRARSKQLLERAPGSTSGSS